MADPYVIAIIPARGGSKRLPGKNVVPLAGRPLVAHSIAHARQARCIREVWVSTDDPAVARVALADNAFVAPRPQEISGDDASSESALKHVLEFRAGQSRPEPELVVFLQPTSPVRSADDIDKAVTTLLRENADSLFSACEDFGLLWTVENGAAIPVNYDVQHRKREQEMRRQIRENGSIYVFKPHILQTMGNRLGGRIAVYEMDYWASFQIDSPQHVALCEWILAR